MAQYDFVVAVTNETEPTRKQQWDIVSVTQDAWGRKIIDEYLIIPISSSV